MATPTPSVWNPENIRDVAESVGLASLPADVTDHLTRDVEFRLSQILEESLRFMRHAKRTTLSTLDISHALRVLDVEPLYGYESTRPLRFGEASLGPGQPLYYVEDEEVDFEKLINAPLPKIPRDITFTAHWLAVEGVQPTIPQNPTPADTPTTLLTKNPSNPSSLASATSGADNLAIKPLVKHILSKELQLYFQHVCAALLDQTNPSYRAAALASLSTDPALHQLLPYLVHFAAEKVTHGLKSSFTLTQTLHLVAALLQNQNLHISPYIPSLVPPVLTCLIGKRLATDAPAPPSALPHHYAIRRLAASVLAALTKTKDAATATPSLKPRLARTLLKHLLAASPQPLGVYYGAVLGLNDVAGAEGVRALVLPNLGALDEVLRGAGEGEAREVDAVVEAVVGGLGLLVGEGGEVEGGLGEGERRAVLERVGEVVGGRVVEFGDARLVRAILAEGSVV